MRTRLIAPILMLMGAAPVPAPAPDTAASVSGRWCGGAFAPPGAEPATEILKGYGPGGFVIATANPRAQAFFDNGMQLAHAFAHKAAVAAFAEARRLDPDCAMCAWGEAWSAGPTINYGIEAGEAKELAKIAETAERLAANGPEGERRLIAALRLRYPATGGTDDKAFAAAMDRIAMDAPEEDALVTLAADALMIAAADWNADTMARPVALLETVLARNPGYAPAIHFYIHATEGAGYPKRAERFADTLKEIAPAASHLVHMPSHTYYWIGRYADAGTANLAAVGIDLENAARHKLATPYMLAYHAHNVHFGIGGALMAGDAATGLALARPLAAIAHQPPKADPFRQTISGLAYVAIARFAPPEEMLALPRPGDDRPAMRALWHYARGEALARRGDAAGVLAEASAIPGRGVKGRFGERMDQMVAVAKLVLKGRAATLRRRHAAAAGLFARAAAIEEATPLGDSADPPLWWYPVRRDHAAALLAAGDAAMAQAAVDASLKRRPRDPVALALKAEIEAKLGTAVATRRPRLIAAQGWQGAPAARRPAT